MKFQIHLIAAARPNFMKIAPLYHALSQEDWAEPVIVHTGQHYDFNMSDAFFRDLRLPDPHIHLGIGSGTHAEQTAKVMTAYEKLLLESRPDMVIVVGDVNSTMACTLASVKVKYPASLESNIDAISEYETGLTVHGARQPESKTRSHELNRAPHAVSRVPVDAQRPLVAHLEAGLRSFDRSMPEEINRVVTDSLADLLWTPSPDGDENLLREGVPLEKIERVGNIMIDSLEMLRPAIEKENAAPKYGLNGSRYGLVTLHRPSNVDSPDNLNQLCESLVRISEKIPLIFPVHPRTRKNLDSYGLFSSLARVGSLKLDEPISYIPFMNLVFNAGLVITDSGGLQEETTYLGIPCLTLRPNTERPITVSQGTNRLCRIGDLESLIDDALNNGFKKGSAPEFWDGKTSQRVVASTLRFFVTHNR